MKTTYKNCQSCGMPMKRDEKGGGTNADGSKNPMYCSHCYLDGKFVLPDMTASAMQERVSKKLGEFGFPKFLHPLFLKKIPTLERWRQPVA
jgi:hypothetical protein